MFFLNKNELKLWEESQLNKGELLGVKRYIDPRLKKTKDYRSNKANFPRWDKENKFIRKQCIRQERRKVKALLKHEKFEDIGIVKKTSGWLTN